MFYYQLLAYMNSKLSKLAVNNMIRHPKSFIKKKAKYRERKTLPH